MNPVLAELVALRRAAEAALGEGAAGWLREGGRAGGARAAADLPGQRRERVERLVAMGRRIGWGDFALDELNTDGFVISVRRSPFAAAYGKAARAGEDAIRHA